jgi:hypothetical protein
MLLIRRPTGPHQVKVNVEVGAVVTGTEKCTACVAGGAAMFLVVAGKMKAVAVGIVGTG